MINKSIRFAIIALFLLLFARPAHSQPDLTDGYHVEHFTDENGLPQNSINDLLFDDHGYLWLASQVGLIRFDGKSFMLYAPEDRPVMESNFVSLGTNALGQLYCQTDDQRLYRQAGGNDLPLNLVNTPSTHRPLLLNTSKQLIDLSSFLGNGRADETEYRRLIFNYLYDHAGNVYATDSSRIYYVYHDTLFYYTGRDIIRPEAMSHAGLANPAYQYCLFGKQLYVLKDDSVKAVYADGRRIGGPAPLGGDLRKDLAEHRLAGIGLRLFSGSRNHLLAGKRLYEISRDPDGSLTTRRLLDLDFINNISAVDCDPVAGLLLVTSQTEGIYFLRKSRFPAPVFAPVLQKEMDRYLFGPMALRGKDVITDRFVFSASGAYTLLPDQNPPWQRCLYIDKNDHIWGAYENVPRQLNAGMQLMKEFPALDGQIVDFKEDKSGKLYCLTERSLWRLGSGGFNRILENDPILSEKGAKKAENGVEKGINYEKGPGAINPTDRTIPENESFCEVAPGLFWIATSNGLVEYDISAGTSRKIPAFAESHVRSIYVCRDSSVLVGTYGQGYQYYRHGRFFKMPLDKNGWLITAHCFLEDSRGFVWIPCNKGLFKVPKQDIDSWCDSSGSAGGSGGAGGGGGAGARQLYYYYYGRQDGLNTNEFNGGFNASGLITPEGLVTLLSMKGMVSFYADSMRSDLPLGPIDMTHLEIDGNPGQVSDRISLAAGYNNLLVEIACPFLGNRNNLYLEYFISGLSKEWKELGSDGIINLSRLSPGNYSLQVRKVNGFGKENFSYRTWSIVVAPHFYQTAWFRALIGIIVLLLICLLVRSQLKLRQKKKELNEKEENLEKSRKALLQTNKMREKLISLVIHDLRSPIRFLSVMANDLHDNLGQLRPEEARERSYWIKKGTQDIYSFSEDFLLWVTSQKNNFSISKGIVPVRPLLQEMAEFFREQTSQKGNCLEFEVMPHGLTIYSDPHILITILRNLVDNANKHTANGRIRIMAYEEAADTVLSVADTGKGMSSEQIQVFLNRENLDGVRSGTQLGHTFIVDLTHKMHGSVSVTSQEGAGTTVVLRFGKEAAGAVTGAGQTN